MLYHCLHVACTAKLLRIENMELLNLFKDKEMDYITNEHNREEEKIMSGSKNIAHFRRLVFVTLFFDNAIRSLSPAILRIVYCFHDHK